MPEAEAWRTRPVFITSTFADMQSERDVLRDRVFPEIAERLQKRFHYLEPIDLRWGVDNLSLPQEHEKDILVLKVCLGEIERSRPFLIGLLGDRYGWVPPAERMQTAIDEAGFATEVTGKSVTALEIEYGVLDSPVQQMRSRFYFRAPLPYDQMTPDTAALYCEEPGSPGAEGLARLKQRLAEQMPPDRVRHYQAKWDPQAGPDGRVTGLEQFAAMVVEDLWEDLAADIQTYATAEPPTWQEGERAALAQFMAQRQRGYVPRRALSGELAQFLQSPPEDQAWGLCLTGEAGSGKSALFAHLHKMLRPKHQAGEILLLAHAAGISPESGRVEMMLRRWVGEICQLLGQADPLTEESSPEEIGQAFSRLLHQAAQERRVILLLDALNQFIPSSQSRGLTWLPKIWPPNARFLATAITGEESEALAQRPGVMVRPLEPMDAKHAADIAASICAVYHRTLNQAVLDALLAKDRPDGAPSYGNPLWLTMAVEELNLLDADDFARAEREFSGSGGQRLHQLLLAVAAELPAEVEPLYTWVLQRSEELWGQSWARSLANLLACSRFGLREIDLESLIPRLSGEPWDPLRFAGLRRSFRAHLVQKGEHGQWDFAHAQGRAAVLGRNLGDSEERKQVHSTIADYLLGLPAQDPLHLSETMHHLMEADDKRRAAEYYGGERSQEEVAGASQVMAERILAGEQKPENQALAWMVELLDLINQEPVTEVIICNHFSNSLQNILEDTARLDTRLALLKAASIRLADLLSAEAHNLVWFQIYAANNLRIGNIMKEEGNQEGALLVYQESRAIMERLATTAPSNTGWQSDLAVCQNLVGNVLKDQGDLAGALSIYKKSADIMKNLAIADPDNVSWQKGLSEAYNNIGDVRMDEGDIACAMRLYQDSLSIRKRLASKDPNNASRQWDLAVLHDKIGDIMMTADSLRGALSAYQESRTIKERLLVADPRNNFFSEGLSNSNMRVGNALMSQGDQPGAIQAFQDALAIMKRLTTADPGNSAWYRDLSVIHEKTGDYLLNQGEFGRALQAYQDSLAIRKRIASAIPDNPGWQRDLWVIYIKLGDVLAALNEQAEALGTYQESSSIMKRLAFKGPTNVERMWEVSVSQERVGDVLMVQGEQTEALRAYRESIQIRRFLTSIDSLNTLWQKHLAYNLQKVGRAMSAQGDRAAALKYYHESLIIFESMVSGDANNADRQRELWAAYYNIAIELEADGTPEANDWWQKAYAVLSGMQQNDISLSDQDKKVLAFLEAKVRH